MSKILVVDDNQAVIDSITLMLELNDFEVVGCESPDAAKAVVAGGGIDVVVQDMNFTANTTSGEEGVALFGELRSIEPDLPIILLTAWADIETAVSLVQKGAADYMAKPWDDTKLLTTIRNLSEMRALQQQNQALQANVSESRSLLDQADLCDTVAESPAMISSIQLAIKVAKSDVPVMIVGPNGAGKEQIANIVQANSPRKDKPFVKVNMGALPAELLEAELFGAEPGAYTGLNKKRIGRFEQADGGTLFLDEIGNLPLEGQAKLLRVLQSQQFEPLGSHHTKQVDVRVITATNADLETMIAQGRFREDLYYRINVIDIPLKPLTERKGDILPLVAQFTDNAKLSADTKQALQNHDWPGNVRELQNACKRALIMGEPPLQPDDFNLSAPQAATEHQLTEAQIKDALERHQGVIAKAARSLGITRQSLYRRIDKFGISL